MAQADSDRLVQYIFPTERLPAHTQELLKEPQGLGRRLLDSWPQYRGRIRHDAAGRPQVYLNLFEYFVFWTAFYVLRGSASDGSRNDPRAPSPSASSTMYGGFRSVGSAIVGNLMLGRPAGTLQSHPYYQLLRTYLDFFLPRSAGGGADGGAAARAAAAAASVASVSGLGIGGAAYGLGMADGGGMSAASSVGWASYKPTLTAAAAGPESRGAVLLSVLVEFWLTDMAEPLPSLSLDRVSGSVQQGGGAGFAGGLVGGGGGLAGVPSPGGAVAGLAGTAAPTPVAVATPPNVRMLAYQPPSEELVEALVVLVRYVTVVEPADGGGARAASGAAAGSSGGGVLRPGIGGGVLSSGGGASAGRAAGSGRGAVQLQPAQAGRPPWLPETPVKTPPLPPPRLLVPPTALVVQGSSASAAVQAVSRKVYRQLRRAFSQWPASSPASLTPLISLWLSVIAPWCPIAAHTRKTAPAADLAAGGAAAGTSGAGGAGAGGAGAGAAGHHSPLHVLDGAAAVVEATAAKLHLGGAGGRDRDVVGATSRELLSQYKYTPAWRSHVLAHLPFYLQLLPAFAALSLSRLKYRPDSALRDLDRVLAVLAAAGPDLLRDLATAEAALNAYARPPAAGGRRRSDGELGEMVPWWLEQVQDFEAAAASGSSPGAVQPDVVGRLFATDTTGAAYTACLLLRSAETLGRPELVSALRQSAGAVLPLDSILPAAVAEQPRAGEGCMAGGADANRFPRPGRWSSLYSSLVAEDPKLADPQRLWLRLYRGRDGRHDPLLRPIASNELGPLVRPLVRASVRINDALGLSRPYVPGEEAEEPPEHMGQQALLWARKRGYRVNLRIFAEVQTLVWLIGLLLLGYTLLRAFGGVAGGTSGAAAGAVAGGGGALAGGVRGGAYQPPPHHQQHNHHQYRQQQAAPGGRVPPQQHQAYRGHQQRHAHGGRADPGLEDVQGGGYRFR
ncbi:hypothetical protein GPECTOR_10g947 [Gonium pectorale]|uniref:Uncharacterized protein n=1 Tax=Gonium pectorale TaxID=33097 RepID=A0A150GR52_GONPE|nr:hypothetical protein GPECTOR_10g947 [Gonium pectorale]|eukprot:KXZ52315.1 hypothetical protein GPECTOR_10g947 [Gonium pectorale]